MKFPTALESVEDSLGTPITPDDEIKKKMSSAAEAEDSAPAVSSQKSVSRCKEKLQTEAIEEAETATENLQMRKYMSLALMDEDEFLYCEECKVEYSGDCPVHGPLLIVEDKEVGYDVKKNEDTNYSLMTLPDGLEVKPSGIKNAGLGVFATKNFSTRTRFGPYKGTKELNENLAHDSGYCWQIWHKGKPSHFVDAKDPSSANWLRYVNCARYDSEECLTAYQHKGEIYYRAHRNITPGTELLVYYGDSYAGDLGIELHKNGNLNASDTHEKHDDDENNYACNKCKLAFSTRICLEHHMQRIHNEYWGWKNRTSGNKHASSPSIKDTSSTCKSNNSMHPYQSVNETACGLKEDDVNSFDDNENPPCELNRGRGPRRRTQKGRNQSCGCHNAPSGMDMKKKGSLDLMMTCEEEKPHICFVCWKVFDLDSHLQKHMRGHNGIKPYKCPLCSKTFSFQKYLQKHMKFHTGKKPFKCPLCSETFARTSVLRRHIRIHLGSDSFKCSVCSKVFDRISHLQRHMRVHTKEKPFKCSVCKQGFGSKSHMHRHLEIHNRGNKYKCDICGEAGFCTKYELKKHARAHTGQKPMRCNECKREFNTRSNMLLHSRRVHNREKLLNCPVCNKVFDWPSHLLRHKAIHTGEKPCNCFVCGKAFAWSSLLKSHMKSHTGGKPFRCSECSKAFDRDSHLKRHMRIHTGEKPFICPVCGRAFSSKSHFGRHSKIHQRNKKFKCDICKEAAFCSNFDLQTHVRTHTGEKPFKCTECSKRFNTSTNMQLHKRRIHTREKPYMCCVCNKSFSGGSDLHNHLRIHTGEKPYKCSHCNEAFNTSSSLQRHIRCHTGEKPHKC